MGTETRIQLEACKFENSETQLIERGELRATLFRYRSGVSAVRLANARGNLVILPYQGQQIWSMEMAGQSLAMKSIFDEPQPTREFLQTYGGFLQHCGMTAMGNPGPNDRHPVHGELPNAPYREAWIIAGTNEEGAYLEIGGTYRHSIAFTCDYLAQPYIRLHESATTVKIGMKLTNLRTTPLDFMYLAHLNFRPADFGRLVYSAPSNVEQVRFRPAAAAALASPEYAAFREKIERDPAVMDVLDPAHRLDPELLMFLRYKADDKGWAHSLHVKPDGRADYVKHRPEQLNHAVRWIVRNGDEDALGLVLPATAEPDGYTAEKAKGNLRSLPSGSNVQFDFEAGLLLPEQAQAMAKHIAGIA